MARSRRVLNSQLDLLKPNQAATAGLDGRRTDWPSANSLYTRSELVCGALDVLLICGGDAIRKSYDEYANENEITRELLAIGVAINFIINYSTNGRLGMRSIRRVVSDHAKAVELASGTEGMVTEKEKRMLTRIRSLCAEHSITIGLADNETE